MKYANTIVSAAIGAALTISLAGSASAIPLETTTEHAMTASVHSPAQPAATKKRKKFCNNVLVRRLYSGGFRGENLREAWAIAMRESGGNPKSVSPTHDYGVFQFNRAAWHKQSWWNASSLLTAPYNIKVAYRISKGGKTWYPWDIGGKGQFLGRYSSASTHAAYKKWYAAYPC